MPVLQKDVRPAFPPIRSNPVWFLIALIIGSAVTGVIYALIKKPSVDETAEEEEDIDIDLDIRIE